MGRKKDVYQQQQTEFREIIASVKDMFSAANNTAEKIQQLDFAIWSLGQEIAGSENYRLFHGVLPQENRNFLLPHFLREASEYAWVDVSRCAVYFGLWKTSSIGNVLRRILKWGYVQKKDANGVYYPELRFAVIVNGRHRTGTAVYSGECIMKLETVSLVPYFSKMETDGVFFSYIDSVGYPAKVFIPDVRLAAMYRLAQMKYTLQQSVQDKDCTSVQTPEMLKKHGKEDDFLAARIDDLYELTVAQQKLIESYRQEIEQLKAKERI